MAALDGAAPFADPGSDMCWTYIAGGVTITAGVRTTSDPPRAVLAVDDRDDRLEHLSGAAWKEWVRLSNWLGISDPGRVTTRTLLDTAPTVATDGVQDAALPAQWQTLLDESVSDAERSLIRALAERGTAAPVLGFETADGDVLDMAWADARIAVVFDDSVEAGMLEGWTLCPPDAAKIIEALMSNGVV
jgi:hypothetical protein